jgi:hypothetical protein
MGGPSAQKQQQQDQSMSIHSNAAINRQGLALQGMDMAGNSVNVNMNTNGTDSKSRQQWGPPAGGGPMGDQSSSSAASTPSSMAPAAAGDGVDAKSAAMGGMNHPFPGLLDPASEWSFLSTCCFFSFW